MGSFEEVGASSLALDNTAVFLGVRGDTANIKRLVYSSSVAARAIGLNRLDNVTAAPEPGGLFATGLVVLIGRRLRARRNTSPGG